MRAINLEFRKNQEVNKNLNGIELFRTTLADVKLKLPEIDDIQEGVRVERM